MAVYDHTEQEQLDELKVWWQQYGNLITGGMLVLALGVAGWQGWNWWQASQAQQAGALYAALEQAAASQDAKRTRDLAGELVEKFGRSNYAAMGAMLSARVQLEANERKTAQAQLSWVATTGADEGLRNLAHVRLATMLIDDQDYDEALKQLAIQLPAPFEPRQAELKGDALQALGKRDEARAAYQLALDKYDALQKSPEALERPGQYRDVLLAKLESAASVGVLAAASASPAAAPASSGGGVTATRATSTVSPEAE